MPQNGLSIDEKAYSAGVNSAGQPLWQCRKCQEGPFERKVSFQSFASESLQHSNLTSIFCARNYALITSSTTVYLVTIAHIQLLTRV